MSPFLPDVKTWQPVHAGGAVSRLANLPRSLVRRGLASVLARPRARGEQPVAADTRFRMPSEASTPRQTEIRTPTTGLPVTRLSNAPANRPAGQTLPSPPPHRPRQSSAR